MYTKYMSFSHHFVSLQHDMISFWISYTGYSSLLMISLVITNNVLLRLSSSYFYGNIIFHDSWFESIFFCQVTPHLLKSRSAILKHDKT